MEATMGMKMASRASSRMDPSKRPMTEAARMAVPRLMSSQTRRFGKTVWAQLVERLIVQLGQHRAGQLAPEQAEERHLIGQREIVQRGRDVGGVGVLEDLAQALAASRLQQVPDGVGEPGGLGHGVAAGALLGGQRRALRRAG
jgi:hypothetical protein